MPLTVGEEAEFRGGPGFVVIHRASAISAKCLLTLSSEGRLFSGDLGDRLAAGGLSQVDLPSVGGYNSGRDGVLFAEAAGLVAISGRGEKRVQVWDSIAKKSIGHLVLEQYPVAIDISGDGKTLAISQAEEAPALGTHSKASLIQLFSLPNFKRVATWKKTGDLLAMSHDGKLIAAVRQPEFMVDILLASDGRVVHSLDTMYDWIHCVEFLPDGSGLVAAGNAGVIHYWDCKTGKSVFPSNKPSRQLASVQLLPGGGYLTASRGGEIAFWSDRGVIEKSTLAIPPRPDSVNASPLGWPPSPLASMALSLDGKTIYLTEMSAKSSIQSWNFREWNLKRRLLVPRYSAEKSNADISLSPDGRTMAVSRAFKGILLLNAKTLAVDRVLEAKALGDQANSSRKFSRSVAVAFAGNERLISIDFGRKHLHIWDLGRKTERSIEVMHKQRFFRLGTTIAVAPDYKRFAVHASNTIYICDANATEHFATHHIIKIGRQNKISCLTYLSNRLIAVGDDFGRIWILDLEKRSEPRLLEGHHGAITCLAVSPDGKHFASGSADTTAIIWKVPTAKK